jgi:hypothetical protein
VSLVITFVDALDEVDNGDLVICDGCFEICVYTVAGTLRPFSLDDVAYYDLTAVAQAVQHAREAHAQRH